MKYHLSFASLILLLLCACQPSANIPDTYTEAKTPAVIYPDYDNITVPPNIAPLTFIVKDSLADAFVAVYSNASNNRSNETSSTYAVGANASGRYTSPSMPDTMASGYAISLLPLILQRSLSTLTFPTVLSNPATNFIVSWGSTSVILPILRRASFTRITAHTMTMKTTV